MLPCYCSADISHRQWPRCEQLNERKKEKRQTKTIEENENWKGAEHLRNALYDKFKTLTKNSKTDICLICAKTHKTKDTENSGLKADITYNTA